MTQCWTRYWKVGAIAMLALATLAPAASAQRLAIGVRVGPRPGFYGPAFYAGPRFYGPGWYGAGYYGLGWYEPYGFVAAPTAGKIKVETKVKATQVYVDAGYAGTVGQLGSFPLSAGTHDVELRSPDGQTVYHQQINVIAGKTADIRL